MKKIFSTLVAVAAVLVLGSPALAANIDNGTTPGTKISLQSGALTLNFSPKVVGSYWTEGTTGNEQWFAIGTYHAGGTMAWATASNFTSTYKKTLPTDAVPTVSTAFSGVNATKASAGAWTGWTAN